MDINKLSQEIKDKYQVLDNALKATSPQAYFCAKVKNDKSNPATALKLARSLGYKLWIPEIEVTDYDYPKGALQCKKTIEDSEVVICQPPIGRDCAWELGYAVGLGKPIYVIGELDEGDWMTKIGVKDV